MQEALASVTEEKKVGIFLNRLDPSSAAMPCVSGLDLSDLMPTRSTELSLLLQLTDKKKEGRRGHTAFPRLFSWAHKKINPFQWNWERQAQCLGSEVLGSSTTFLTLLSQFYSFVSMSTCVFLSSLK